MVLRWFGVGALGQRHFLKEDRSISLNSCAIFEFNGSKCGPDERKVASVLCASQSSVEVPMHRAGRLNFFFFLFLLILYFAIAFCLLVCLLFFSIVRLGGFRGFQNVLLRVALKHRGSVAAGLRCGLWPADSVGCGDCGLAASVVGGTRGGSSVGTFASSTAPTRCRETRRLAVTAFCRGAARLAYLSARIPPRVNQSHH